MIIVSAIKTVQAQVKMFFQTMLLEENTGTLSSLGNTVNVHALSMTDFTLIMVQAKECGIVLFSNNYL